MMALKTMGHDISAIFRTANYCANYAVSQRSNDRVRGEPGDEASLWLHF